MEAARGRHRYGEDDNALVDHEGPGDEQRQPGVERLFDVVLDGVVGDGEDRGDGDEQHRQGYRQHAGAQSLARQDLARQRVGKGGIGRRRVLQSTSLG